MIFNEIFFIALCMYTLLYTIGWILDFGNFKYQKNYFVLGLIYFIVGVSILSNLTGFSVSVSGKAFMFFTILVGLLRLRNLKVFLPKFDLTNFGLGLFFVVFNTVMLWAINKPFGVANFDFFNAVQDGRFLESHSSLESYTNNRVIPLTWSAGIGSRYGISLFLANMNNLFPNHSILIIGEACLVLFSAIGFFMLYKLGRTLYKKSRSQILVATLLANCSALSVYQINNQMFGQITALPIVYFILILLISQNQRSITRFQLSMSIIAIYILYPSIILPVGLAILLYTIYQLSKKELSVRDSLSLLGLLGFLYILVYSSSPLWPIRMLLSFTLPQASATQVNPQANLFPQITSLIGPGQFLGTIPIPFVERWGISVALLSILSFISLLIFFFHTKKLNYVNSYSQPVLSIMMGSFLIFALYSYLINNSYVVLKIGTWIAPLIMFGFLMYIFNQVSNREYSSRITTLILVFVVLSNFIVSSQQVFRAREGKATSFPQLVYPNDTSKLSDYIALHNRNKLGFVLPTAEEVAWVATNFPISYQKSVLSIGAQNQALAEIEKKNCNPSKVKTAFNKIDYMVLKKQLIDVTPQPVILNNLEIGFEDENWKVSKIDNVESALVVYSGLFPPTINSQIEENPIPRSTSLRWSSGRACFAFFSNSDGMAQFNIPILIGPDSGNSPKFKLEDSSYFNVLDQSDNLKNIEFVRNVSKGWNYYKLEMIGEIQPQLPRFFNVRADSRKLAFAIGSITYEFNHVAQASRRSQSR